MALPVYAMSCFRLTKHHCQKIMSAMSAFWWNECSDKKKIHWVSWPNLCLPKDLGGLGFRDIEDFNQALLAKQAWKLLNEPQSLLSQVYKGRYYANKEFLECGKGYRPSYAWRSILFGRELLQKGLIKSIGNGNSTYVWGEKWIMDDSPRRSVNRQLLIDVMLKVSSLTDGSGGWNNDLLVELFPPNEVHRIQQMRPGLAEDCYIWAYSRQGAYTVKTGYEILVREKVLQAGQISQQEQVRNNLKKKIWKMPTLPKVRMFLWRAVSGALAVAERLNHRGLGVDTTCKLCHNGLETINHVLFQCSAASNTLSDAGIPLLVVTLQQSLEDNLTLVFNLMEDKSRPQNIVRAIPWILWLIWKSRNSILYAETQISKDRALQEMREEIEQWFLLNMPIVQDSGERSNGEIWLPPEEGVIKCNIHANWRNTVLHSGVAWLARDESGNVSYHARDAFIQTPNRMIAELRCVIWALTSLHDLGVTRVIISSDYREVMEALKLPLQWPRYRELISQVLKLTEKFVMVSFETEKVSANGIARDIARSVLRDGRLRSYLALGGPSWLHDRLARERNGSDI